MKDRRLPAAIEAAYQLVRDSVIEYQGQPVGVVAALHPDLPAENYAECFLRDFIPSGLLFLLDGECDIVRNFLKTTLKLAGSTVGFLMCPSISCWVVRNSKVVLRKFLTIAHSPSSRNRRPEGMKSRRKHSA